MRRGRERHIGREGGREYGKSSGVVQDELAGLNLGGVFGVVESVGG